MTTLNAALIGLLVGSLIVDVILGACLIASNHENARLDKLNDDLLENFEQSLK